VITESGTVPRNPWTSAPGDARPRGCLASRAQVPIGRVFKDRHSLEREDVLVSQRERNHSVWAIDRIPTPATLRLTYVLCAAPGIRSVTSVPRSPKLLALYTIVPYVPAPARAAPHSINTRLIDPVDRPA